MKSIQTKKKYATEILYSKENYTIKKYKNGQYKNDKHANEIKYTNE